VRRLACALLLLAAPVPLAAAAATPVDGSVAFLLAREQGDGGFAEPGRQSTPGLSAWAVLALVAAGRTPDAKALAYLHAQSGGSAADLDLRALALTAAGEDASALLDRIAADARADGTIGDYVNSTAWGVLALRAGGRAIPAATVPHLLAAQSANGGWSWSGKGAGDADDTAAVVEALRVAGQPAASRPIQRALAFLRRCRTASGGFATSPGGTPNAQTSAWAIQAFAAAGASPGKHALAYLARLRQRNGSYRYAPTLAVTPVWVTSEVVPALLRKPFPLRRPAG
jgi:energy-coupling factor transport system substrate-specific component